MPDGNELGNPNLVLGQDRLQGVVPTLVLPPLPELDPSSPVTGGLSGPRRSPLVADRSCNTVDGGGAFCVTVPVMAPLPLERGQMSVPGARTRAASLPERTVPQEFPGQRGERQRRPSTRPHGSSAMEMGGTGATW